VPTYLPAVLLATLALISRPPAPVPLAFHDLATLSDAQARRLAGQRALFRVFVEGEPDGDEEHGWRYDCRGEGAPLRTLWLRDGDDITAAWAQRGSRLLQLEATLRRIVHPPIRGADGSSLPALLSTGS
jgi:hypothetical protein